MIFPTICLFLCPEQVYELKAKSFPRRFVLPLDVSVDTPEGKNLSPLSYSSASAVKQGDGEVGSRRISDWGWSLVTSPYSLAALQRLWCPAGFITFGRAWVRSWKLVCTRATETGWDGHPWLIVLSVSWARSMELASGYEVFQIDPTIPTFWRHCFAHGNGTVQLCLALAE